MILGAQVTTENPYKTEFRQVVQAKKDPKTGILRNIFHSSKPVGLSASLWDCKWSQREYQWSLACVESYRNLPVMPTPVSPSQMAKQWGCSQVTAKKLILGDWDWLQVSKRHYVHSSTVDETSWIYKVCRSSGNPLSCFAAVNLLRDYVPDENDKFPAGVRALTTAIGHSKLCRLREAGILKSILPLRTRKVIYYVPTIRRLPTKIRNPNSCGYLG